MIITLSGGRGEKILVFFSCKRPFFFYRKKGKGVTAPPYFREKCSEGGGQLGGFALIVVPDA